MAFVHGCAAVESKFDSVGTKSLETELICPLDNRIIPGQSTKEDLLGALGTPYIDIRDNDGRLQWVYMETLKTQIIYTFEEDQVFSIHRSNKYGHPVFRSGS